MRTYVITCYDASAADSMLAYLRTPRWQGIVRDVDYSKNSDSLLTVETLRELNDAEERDINAFDIVDFIVKLPLVSAA